MQIELKKQLHPRVFDNCIALFDEKHYEYASLEAMKLVEAELKRKGMTPDRLSGENLIKFVLGGGGIPRLKTPFGDYQQEAAKLLFRGAFSYYRNYVAHDGSEIDERICIRILFIATELLEMLDASILSFVGIEELEKLYASRLFTDNSQLKDLLGFLDQNHFADLDPGGFYERANELGFSEEQVIIAFELGLVEWEQGPLDMGDSMIEDFSWLILSELGRKVYSAL